MLIGSNSIGANPDNNGAGVAEAFQYTASASGTVNQIYLYVDSNNTATQVDVGLYTDTGSDAPGNLLVQAALTNPVNGAWNSVNTSPVTVTANVKYWIAVLGPVGAGTVQFRDVASGGKSQASLQTNLSLLTATWSAGSTYANSPLSAYAFQNPGSSATATATTPTATQTATATPTPTSTPSAAATSTPTATNAATVSPPPTHTAAPTASLTATTSAGSPVVFPVGAGDSDVLPHQILRASNDRLYLFTSQQYATTIRAYWTSAPGLPNAQAAFDSSTALSASADPISVEAVGDGGHFVHVLSNLNNGELRDYPFDLNTGTFGSSVLLASGNPTVVGDYIGSDGLSAMLDLSGTLHLAYWAAGNHIIYRAYSVATVTGALTLTSGPTQVDTAGNANHPSVAVSPLDNSLTVAWVSQATSPAQILARSRTSAGSWGSLETVSTAPVWTSVNFGVNIDQGPSLLIDPSGTKHLAYIENWDSTRSYGRIHYVVNTGSGWTDTALNSYTHDPALALNSAGDVYIIGHGHPQSQNTLCTSTDEMCTIKKNGATWGSQQVLATPPAGQSFDSSVSVKRSVVGFNRPETIEFVFFMTPYNGPTLYYGRLP